MQLSVVIVNYNVCHFLEQAVRSALTAMEGIEGEVWVVDNQSVDESVRMVREKFPQVKLIANEVNVGFAKANNQAMRLSTGKYCLLLNPDTVVEEDTFRTCLAFMEANPEAGALGVRLIDGSGNYLPESKRGFPTPWVAFCKTVGLSSFFPKSKTFNGYYLGHLNAAETHEVDVLAGCFMFMRREALDKSGLLDEAFFMYGEDIDLSYRIVQAGYKNYYLSTAQIIHYKGESTKKGSLNYVRTFYQAMIIFAEKHFGNSSGGRFYVLMLRAAIWFRAGITLLRNALTRFLFPILDALFIFFGLLGLKNFWAVYYYKNPDHFEPNLIYFNFPLYTGVWLLSVWLVGGYDHRFDLRRLVRGLALGTLFLSAIYGFLELEYRPSRALVLLGAIWAALATLAIRALAHKILYKTFDVGRNAPQKLLVIGSEAESKRVLQLLREAGVEKNFIGTINPQEEAVDSGFFLSPLRNLEEVTRIYKVEELIFCGKDIATTDILGWMTRLGPQIAYKIMPEDSVSIIGSSSKNQQGELYTFEIKYNLAQNDQRRTKRLLDLIVCLLVPILAIFSTKRSRFLQNWGSVLLGKKTWVGYAYPLEAQLPALKSGVFSPRDGLPNASPNVTMIKRLDFMYAKDWSFWKDLEIIVSN